jgi:hypothetical protein
VPSQFLSQIPGVANPPTLFLPIMVLAQAVAARERGELVKLFEGPYAGAISQERWLDFLRRVFPRLLLWFHWFDREQASKKAGSYRYCTLKQSSPSALPSVRPLLSSNMKLHRYAIHELAHCHRFT